MRRTIAADAWAPWTSPPARSSSERSAARSEASAPYLLTKCAAQAHVSHTPIVGAVTRQPSRSSRRSRTSARRTGRRTPTSGLAVLADQLFRPILSSCSHSIFRLMDWAFLLGTEYEHKRSSTNRRLSCSFSTRPRSLRSLPSSPPSPRWSGHGGASHEQQAARRHRRLPPPRLHATGRLPHLQAGGRA